MDLTTEEELAEVCTGKPLAWLQRYVAWHYSQARVYVSRARFMYHGFRERELAAARLERDLARIARRELRRRRELAS